MNFPTFPRNRLTFLFLPSLFLCASLLFSLAFVGQDSHAQQQAKLSLSDILIALRSKKVTLAERNQIVTEAVKQRGITFVLTPEIEKELEAAGADKTLLEAIRAQSPAAQPTATPTPTPAPTPAPTPKPPDWQTFQNQANDAFVKGDFNAAIAGYGKVIALNSKEPSPYMNRGMAFYNQKNYDSAIYDFSKAIELNPQDSTVYFKRGETFEKIGKVQNALEDYQKAVELEADNELAKTSIARLQAQQRKIVIGQPKAEKTEKNNEKTEKPEKTEKTESTVKNSETIVEIGSLKDIAIKLAVPIYPAYERMRRSEGVVTVLVTLDENGKVIEATATSGPKTLRQFAEDAVKKSKFNPAKVNDQPVKVRGYVAYNFKAS